MHSPIIEIHKNIYRHSPKVIKNYMLQNLSGLNKIGAEYSAAYPTL